MDTSRKNNMIYLLPMIGMLLACVPSVSQLNATELTLHFTQGERVIVVLKDGSEVIGELVDETETEISVKSVFGVTTIESSRIEEVIRGEEVDRREFRKREKSANRRGSAKAFLDLARWAAERGLDTQSKSAYQRALELDPENEPAKIGLGWGQTSDGVWKKPGEVKELISQGWSLVGGELSSPKESTGRPVSGGKV